MTSTNEVSRDGAVLQELRVLWTMSQDDEPEAWIAGLLKGGLKAGTAPEQSGDTPVRAWASALPQHTASSNFYIYFDVHEHTADTKEFHCLLSWLEQPESEPPGDIREMSKAVGGTDGLLRILEETWKLGRTKALVTADFRLEQDTWGQRSAAMRELRDSRDFSGKTYRKTAIMWAAEETGKGVEGLTTILTSALDDKISLIMARGRFDVTINSTMREEVGDQVWPQLAAFLEGK